MSKILKKKDLKIFVHGPVMGNTYAIDMPNLDIPRRDVYLKKNQQKALKAFAECDYIVKVYEYKLLINDDKGNCVFEYSKEYKEIFGIIIMHILEMELMESGVMPGLYSYIMTATDDAHAVNSIMSKLRMVKAANKKANKNSLNTFKWD